jgi:hypothetical protein
MACNEMKANFLIESCSLNVINGRQLAGSDQFTELSTVVFSSCIIT